MFTFSANTRIKSSQVNQNFADLASGIADTDQNSLNLLRRLEFFNHVQTGFTHPTSANLTATMAAGSAIVNGIYVTRTALAKTFTASKDTYIDLLDDGTVIYIALANGATTGMTLSTNTDGSPALRLAKVTTSTTAITVVQQFGLDALGNSIYNTSGDERNHLVKCGVQGTRFGTTNGSRTEVPGSRFNYRTGNKPEKLIIKLDHMSWITGGAGAAGVGRDSNQSVGELEGYVDNGSPWVRSTLDYEYTVAANTTVSLYMWMYVEGGGGGTVNTCNEQARWTPQIRVIAKKAG